MGKTTPKLSPNGETARKLKAENPTIDVSMTEEGKALDDGAPVPTRKR